MTGETPSPPATMIITNYATSKTGRLYYLDWLRVILIFGVFLFHALAPFAALFDYHITNTERSLAATLYARLIDPWGIPLFFIVAGAASMLALRRRNSRHYTIERVNRLLIPFVVGAILLTPFQKYLEALHKETFQGSYANFLPEILTESTSGNLFSPLTLTRWGYHLWFLAFLFLFSLLALPIFNWFKRDAGGSFIYWLGGLAEKRGGILLFALPLALARILVQPFFPPYEHGWLDFIYSFLFFVLGYVIFSDDRFLGAIRRDRWLLFASGFVGLLAFFGLVAAYGDIAFEWAQTFVVPWSIILILAFTLMSWGWALFVLSLAMTSLNFSNKWLVYGNDTLMPFYLLHQPVIIVIAYFVVQWDVGLWVKLPIVVISSFFITLGLVELLIRPFKPIRRLFGMKLRGGREEETRTAVA
jgi:peptidoglycan/LPS O-acetylase OafA/YrhL